MESLILKVAEDLFMDKGFNGVSTTEIAQKVGCNQALIHYYYRTKANLFQKVFENKLRYLVSQFDITDDNEEDFEERLRNRIAKHYEILKQNPKLPIFILNEINNNSETIHWLKEAFKNNIPSFIVKFQKELDEEVKINRIREVNAMDIILNIISLNVFMFISLPIVEYVFNSQNESIDQFVENRKKEIIQTILNSIRLNNK
ncbi:MAG: TetR/AcrR family transcriptional regulator [Bacteroidales bacterium]|nr:TetR/AcrR family transcriptional regulator [Bacteroidales bacterium]